MSSVENKIVITTGAGSSNHYVITHGFSKKTEKTPSRKISKAKRLRETYLRRRQNDTY